MARENLIISFLNRSQLIAVAAVLLFSQCTTISAISLDCTFGILVNRYACQARVLFDGNEKVSTVFGAHQTGMGHDDVLVLSLMSQNLPFFPTNIEAFFPNTVTIYLNDNTISNVNNSHLIPLQSLQTLGLANNRLTTLDSSLFSGMTSLSYISFANNNIRHIGHDISLPDGGSIYFNSNDCISDFATTPAEVDSLRLELLRQCPPTISQIGESLEVGGLNSRITHLETRNTYLETGFIQLETRIAFLEAIIENRLGLKMENL